MSLNVIVHNMLAIHDTVLAQNFFFKQLVYFQVIKPIKNLIKNTQLNYASSVTTSFICTIFVSQLKILKMQIFKTTIQFTILFKKLVKKFQELFMSFLNNFILIFYVHKINCLFIKIFICQTCYILCLITYYFSEVFKICLI